MMSNPRRWNTLNAMYFGAFFGLLYAVYRIVIVDGTWNAGGLVLIYNMSLIGGGTVGGAVILAAVSGSYVRKLVTV